MLFCLNEKKLDTMANFLKENIKDKRFQDLPKYHRINGAIYIAKVKNS